MVSYHLHTRCSDTHTNTHTNIHKYTHTHTRWHTQPDTHTDRQIYIHTDTQKYTHPLVISCKTKSVFCPILTSWIYIKWHQSDGRYDLKVFHGRTVPDTRSIPFAVNRLFLALYDGYPAAGWAEGTWWEGINIENQAWVLKKAKKGSERCIRQDHHHQALMLKVFH
jgi:hypothetical protein